jgi:hypothetical protein
MCGALGTTEIIVYGEDSTESRAKGVKREFTLQKQSKNYGN